MKELIIILAIGLSIMGGVSWAMTTSIINYNGTDFINDVSENIQGNEVIVTATLPLQVGSNVRSININFTGNTVTLQTNSL